MIGASYRPSLRETLILGAIVGVHTAARVALTLTALGLAVVATVIVRAGGYDPDEVFGDSGVA